MLRHFLWIAIFFLALGCAGATDDPPDPRLLVDPSLRSLKQVTLTEPQLEDGTRVMALEAWNDSSLAVTGWWMVEWFDGNGLRIDSSRSKWLPFKAQPKSYLTFQEAWPSPGAVWFRVQLKKDIQ